MVSTRAAAKKQDQEEEEEKQQQYNVTLKCAVPNTYDFVIHSCSTLFVLCIFFFAITTLDLYFGCDKHRRCITDTVVACVVDRVSGNTTYIDRGMFCRNLATESCRLYFDNERFCT